MHDFQKEGRRKSRFPNHVVQLPPQEERDHHTQRRSCIKQAQDIILAGANK